MSDELLADLERLLEATRAITSSLAIEEQLPIIVRAAVELTHADKGLLILAGANGAEVRTTYPASELGKYSTSVMAQVMQTGEPLFILDTDLQKSSGTSKSLRALHVRTVMCVPLRSRTGADGVLYVHSTTPVRAFTEQKKEIFQALCDHAAIALDNARLYAASVSDPMTGLYNHAYCLRRLDEEVDRAKRYRRHLAFLLLDIDRFKDVNDSKGHRAGDRVIGEVAEVLRETIRHSDIAARYGGDEFGLIVPETGAKDSGNPPSDGALILAERLRERIAARSGITVSIGVAVMDGVAPATTESMIDRADKAMYAAKHAGSNRVVEAE